MTEDVRELSGSVGKEKHFIARAAESPPCTLGSFLGGAG